MGKEIIWSPSSIWQLEQIHSDIFKLSKSIVIADKIVNQIINSTEILSTRPEIYKLDANKRNNDGSYRCFEIRTYNVSYRIVNDGIRILRIRYSGKEPKMY